MVMVEHVSAHPALEPEDAKQLKSSRERIRNYFQDDNYSDPTLPSARTGGQLVIGGKIVDTRGILNRQSPIQVDEEDVMKDDLNDRVIMEEEEEKPEEVWLPESDDDPKIEGEVE